MTRLAFGFPIFILQFAICNSPYPFSHYDSLGHSGKLPNPPFWCSCGRFWDSVDAQR